MKLSKGNQKKFRKHPKITLINFWMLTKFLLISCNMPDARKTLKINFSGSVNNIVIQLKYLTLFVNLFQFKCYDKRSD